ncbi:F-box domain-containing protein [Mycena kentingensis (nom. inval.)]|nr:F-box domain-containing protein [Mycena kentingensis (nom. inval.)]
MEFLWRLIRPTTTAMTAPSSTDARTGARVLLASVKLDLQRLDEQIAHLAAQREEQVQLIALLTSMDPPIQRVPNEVLSEDFLDLVQQSLMLDGGFCAALRVSHVCKRWRGVSLSTRRLWTSVPLKQFANLEATKTLVQRSHPLPLSCTLARPLEAHDLDDVLGSAWDRLADFFTTQIAALHALNRLAAGAPFKLLRRLVVGPLDIPDEKIPLALFANAPLLREAALTHTILPLPFAQLTQLQLAHGSGDICLEAVRQCRNLTILNLAMNPWVEIGPQADVVPHTLPAVEEFALRFCPHPDDARHCIEPMLAALDLPALVNFSLRFTDDIEWPETAQRDHVFEGFLQRASKLRIMELVNCTLDSAQLLGALRNTPALEETALTHCETADERLFGRAYRSGPRG